MKQLLWDSIELLVKFSVLFTLYNRGFGAGLDYVCYPNSTIVITNPADYTTIFASNANSRCNVSVMEDLSTFRVEDCDLNLEIFLSFSNRTEDIDVIIGGATAGKSYSILCLDIMAMGITRSIVQRYTAVDNILDSGDIYPSFEITSNIYTDETEAVQLSSAPVGGPLYWTIDGNPKYNMMPLACVAYGGLEVLSTALNKTIIVDGCTVDSQLALDFSWFNSTYGSKLFTTFFTFRFYQSDYITIWCKLLICQLNSTACDIDCSSRRRKRSDEFVVDLTSVGTVAIETHLNVKAKPKRYVLSETTSVELECLWFVLVVMVLMRA